ncbi:MAG: hydroxymethylbilane synthase, partial [Flavobacterium sp.]|nr:hydroxymethylbilane synthase [Flavobacterium sp.]
NFVDYKSFGGNCAQTILEQGGAVLMQQLRSQLKVK